MSKKTPVHKRIFKLYKAGFYNKVPMTEEEQLILEKYYPWIFQQQFQQIN